MRYYAGNWKFTSRSPCSILSNAFDKLNSTKAVTCFRSIALYVKSVLKIFSVSVECCFLFPFWCSLRQFPRIMYSFRWLSAARSQIWHGAGRSDTGRLLLGISWSPSFKIGTRSNSFQAEGKTVIKSEWFTMSVRTARITRRPPLLLVFPRCLGWRKWLNNFPCF